MIQLDSMLLGYAFLFIYFDSLPFEMFSPFTFDVISDMFGFR